MTERRRALCLTVLASFLWGTSFPVIKVGLMFVDPFTLVFLRMFVASILVFSVCYAINKLNFSLAKERLVWVLGLVNGFAYLVQDVGMSLTSASKASLFVNLTVVWVAVLSWLLLKERFSKMKILGIIVGLVGVFFVTTNLNIVELTQGMIVGDGLVVLAGVLWSFFIFYSKRVANAYEAFQLMPWIFLATTLPLALFTPLFSSSLLTLPFEAWTIVVYTAVFCWVIPYSLWLNGLKHISSVTSTVVLLLEVVVAIVISFFFLAETLTLVSVIGVSLIFLAIIFVSGK